MAFYHKGKYMKFYVGQHLKEEMNQKIFTATVLRRTEKTVTIQLPNKTKRCVIHVFDGRECIFPFKKEKYVFSYPAFCA